MAHADQKLIFKYLFPSAITFFKVFFLVFLLFTSCGIIEMQQTEIGLSHCKLD